MQEQNYQEEDKKEYQSKQENDKEVQTHTSGEVEEVSKPTINKVVSVGCEEHDFVEDWWDANESRWHYQCQKCWQGKYGPKVERK
jgi:hypothetical protein